HRFNFLQELGPLSGRQNAEAIPHSRFGKNHQRKIDRIFRSPAKRHGHPPLSVQAVAINGSEYHFACTDIRHSSILLSLTTFPIISHELLLLKHNLPL